MSETNFAVGLIKFVGGEPAGKIKYAKNEIAVNGIGTVKSLSPLLAKIYQVQLTVHNRTIVTYANFRPIRLSLIS